MQAADAADRGVRPEVRVRSADSPRERPTQEPHHQPDRPGVDQPVPVRVQDALSQERQDAGPDAHEGVVSVVVVLGVAAYQVIDWLFMT